MKKTPRKWPKRPFFHLLRLIARPPGGQIPKKRMRTLRICPKSTSCKFHPQTPKNKTTSREKTRERTRLYLRSHPLFQKENHLASLGGWNKKNTHFLTYCEDSWSVFIVQRCGVLSGHLVARGSILVHIADYHQLQGKPVKFCTLNFQINDTT